MSPSTCLHAAPWMYGAQALSKSKKKGEEDVVTRKGYAGSRLEMGTI